MNAELAATGEQLLTSHRQPPSWSSRQGTSTVKITIFGLTISSSWGNGHATPYRAILKALHRQGHQIHFFEKDVPYYRSRRDFDSAPYCQLHLYTEWAEIRKVALSEADSSDVVLTASYLPEGRRINDEVLDLGHALKVFYDLDTPVTLAALSAGNAEYLSSEQLSEFDLVLSFTGGPILAELENRYGVRMARPLYGCVDPDDYYRVEPSPDFQCDLSYMGTYASGRQEKVDSLFLEPARLHPEKQFVLAGSLYPYGWQWPGNVRRIEHVALREHPRFYSSSRITLNITRTEMAKWGWCPSGRFFEAAACGTPVVTDWWEGLDWFFDVAGDLLVVDRPEHVEQAMAMSDIDLSALARQARQRTLDDHTGQVRARQLLEYLEEARSGAELKASEAAR